MPRVFDKLISIQRINETTEQWETVYTVHAHINKAKADNEYLSSGAIQAHRSLVFEVRYFIDLEDISYDLQTYRILFNGVPFNIVDYDDYMLSHKTVKLSGVSY